MPHLASVLAATSSSSSGSSALSLLFLPIMFVGAYFLLIRPQRRRLKQQTNLQSSLQEGDEVITTSGMYGFITGFDGDIIWLEIDDNIQVRVARAAVQRKVDTSGASQTEPVREPIKTDKGDSSKGDAAKGNGTSNHATAIDDIVDDASDH